MVKSYLNQKRRALSLIFVVATWAIVDNKLYFNYNRDVQKLWNKDQKGLIEKANRNWPTVKKE